jgi:hypothetical protein
MIHMIQELFGQTLSAGSGAAGSWAPEIRDSAHGRREKAAHEADRAEAEAGIDMVSDSSPTLARGHKPLSLNGDLVTRLTDALPGLAKFG